MAGYALALFVLVEEPYLLRSHGGRYASYASRVGRFVPGFGKLKTHSEPS
jgi:protein-S-isoprenylcysteine O-methyltransferase Ste14